MSKPTAEELHDRVAHHPPTKTAIDLHTFVRAITLTAMEQFNERLPEGRELSLALTNLEQAMFWGNAAIARNLSPINPDEPLQSTGRVLDDEPDYDEQAFGVGLEGMPSGREVNVIPPEEVEDIVGAKRHPTNHIAHVNADGWNILHSQDCFDHKDEHPLENCAFTKAALLTDFVSTEWAEFFDRPVIVGIPSDSGRLYPIKDYTDDQPVPTST